MLIVPSHPVLENKNEKIGKLVIVQNCLVPIGYLGYHAVLTLTGFMKKHEPYQFNQDRLHWKQNKWCFCNFSDRFCTCYITNVRLLKLQIERDRDREWHTDRRHDDAFREAERNREREWHRDQRQDEAFREVGWQLQIKQHSRNFLTHSVEHWAYFLFLYSCRVSNPFSWILLKVQWKKTEKIKFPGGTF